MSEVISGASILTEVQGADAEGVAGVLLLVEVIDVTTPVGIRPLTLHSRSETLHVKNKRKLFTTLNDRSTALTLEAKEL